MCGILPRHISHISLAELYENLSPTWNENLFRGDFHPKEPTLLAIR